MSGGWGSNIYSNPFLAKTGPIGIDVAPDANIELLNRALGGAVGSSVDVALQATANKLLMYLRSSGNTASDLDILRAVNSSGVDGVVINKLAQLTAKINLLKPQWEAQAADYTLTIANYSFQALTKVGAQTGTLPVIANGEKLYYFCDFNGDAATQAKKIQVGSLTDRMYGVGVTAGNQTTTRDYFQMTKNYQCVVIGCSSSRWFVLGAT